MTDRLVILNAVACSTTCLSCEDWQARWLFESQGLVSTQRVVDEEELLSVFNREAARGLPVVVCQCGVQLTRACYERLSAAVLSAEHPYVLATPLFRSPVHGLHHPIPFPSGGWLSFPGGVSGLGSAWLTGDWDPIFTACFALSPKAIGGSGASLAVSSGLVDMPAASPLNELSLQLRMRGLRQVVVPDCVALVITPGAESSSVVTGRDPNPESSCAVNDRVLAQLRRTRARFLMARMAQSFDSGEERIDARGLLLDCRGLGSRVNGTRLGALALLDALCARLVSPTILVNPEQASTEDWWRRWPDAEVVTEPDWQHRYGLAFRLNQLWSSDDFEYLHEVAATQVIWMLDKILWDSTPPSPDLGWVNQAVSSTFDGVLFLTKASRRQYLSEFPRPSGMISRLLPNSLDPKEYRRPFAGKGAPAIFVAGNSLPHKDVQWAVQILRGSFPDLAVSSLIAEGGDGMLSERDVHELLAGAQLIVFPSHSEGFGMPILEAAAYGAPLLLRDTPVSRELLECVEVGDSAFFCDDVSLVQGAASLLDGSRGSRATSGDREQRGWSYAAGVVIDVIRQVLDGADGSLFAARECLLAARRQRGDQASDG